MSLRAQLDYVIKEGWLPHFLEGAYGCQPHILLGIASRETNCKSIVGDYNPVTHQPHGYGIMQIDDRSFPQWCASGKWKDVGEAVRMGAFVLASKLNAAKGLVREADAMRVAVASYNAGKHAIQDYLTHGDPDLRTTGHNYARDVLARAEWFKTALSKSGVPAPDPELAPAPAEEQKLSLLDRFKSLFS